VYSKEKGFTRPPTGVPRSPIRAARVSVPPNYSGHAIVDGEERPLGFLRADDPPAEDRSDLPTPRFDGLPRVSDLGGGTRHPPRSPLPASYEAAETVPTPFPVSTIPTGASPRPHGETRAADPSPPPRESERGERRAEDSPFRFLSGQGLGLEELLLLGLILFLLRESGDGDRGDLDETVILLGLLLFWG
jgi:hypothetical protein